MKLRIVDLIFGAVPEDHRRRRMVAIGTTLAIYAICFGLATQVKRHTLAPPIPAPTELSVDMAPPPPPPKIEPPPPPKAETHAPPPEQHEPVVASKEPPPPAEAGKLIDAEPAANEPADLTGNTFVSGEAKQYAGGVTRADGTNTVAVHAPDIDPKAKPGARDRSKPVALSAEDWNCPWPREADQENIDEQTAVVRVFVASNGAVTQASVVEDPGFGFGIAALSCAKRTRFEPARDHDGRAISAASPPIRVRFTR
ncbi:MAG TPA: TonB family protein [bacterium]|nr:TonB family protein [bacterium]